MDKAYGGTFHCRFSVKQAVAMRKKRVQESRAQGAENRQRRHEEALTKRNSAPQ
jgi:hypothetical protein